MSNFGLHKNETFFEHNFKHINLYLDLYKTNENILFSLPLYSSIVSKILSISLIYNKLETTSSICNNLSLNLYSFISNKTNNYLDLRFFDGYTYRFYKNVDKYECNELDAGVAINGLTATLTIPVYKKLTYDQNGTNYYLTKIEGYSEEVAFSYNANNQLIGITSNAYESESISLSYSGFQVTISIYRNNIPIYEYIIERINGVLTSIVAKSDNHIIYQYNFSFQNNGISISDSANSSISLYKNNNTYPFTDELNLITTLE